MEEEKIYIIIINYKSEDVIGAAVSSFDEENINIHIVILDNGSTNDTYQKLRTAVGENVEIIRSEKNLGYAGGANYAAKYIKDTYKDLKYLFFFNPDAVSTKNMLGTLYKTLSKHPDVAAVSPKIYDMDDNIYFNGVNIDWDNCKMVYNPIVDNPDEIRTIDTFHGCAVLMDAKIFFDVNMFNEDLFIYYDEPFITMEFLKHGYKCLYEPHTTAFHHSSHSAGSESTFKDTLMTRNHIKFFKKYGTSKKFLCVYLSPLKMIRHYTRRGLFKNIFYIAREILYSLKDNNPKAN